MVKKVDSEDFRQALSSLDNYSILVVNKILIVKKKTEKDSKKRNFFVFGNLYYIYRKQKNK